MVTNYFLKYREEYDVCDDNDYHTVENYNFKDDLDSWVRLIITKKLFTKTQLRLKYSLINPSH